MFTLGPFGDRIIATREIDARPARFAPVPASLDPRLKAALADQGIEQLYSHQATMYERARAGDNVVITTGTASGKTLSFLLPVLQTILEDPAERVLLLYPTKALARDQLRGLLRLASDLAFGPGGTMRLEAGVYDGDTRPTDRKRLRERANLVLTNPDMLNAGLIPAHGREGYSHLFRHVRYIVIDELHTYRGAFGAHFANLMRRLLRICRHYGSTPQILASSATIANPQDLAERLCHLPFHHVGDDGSPAPRKTVHFWMPPLLDDDTRRSVQQEMAELLPHLVENRNKTIAFCRSRKATEVVVKEARDRLRSVGGGHNEANLLGAYRGGYTPSERRKVEKDLLSGRLLGVVSTNALELGVDIGQLEVVVQGGFPGTRASFWQQLGRAGRRGRDAHAIVILAMTPIDQFIATEPGWLTDQQAEHAVVDPDNLTVQLAHVRAAAAELPLTLDDAALWPDLGEVIAVLEEAGELREVHATFHWAGEAFPAGDFSLRNTDGDRFKIVDRTTGETLTEMNRPQVYREAHPRAVYLHDGRQYMVEELDLVGHRSVVVPVDQNFYTQPDVRSHIEVTVAQEQRDVAQTQAWFGDVRVDDTVVGYKMLQFHNHQNLGYEFLRQELPIKLETEGFWLPVPEDVLEVISAESQDALRGVVHAITAIARMKTMAEGGDLLGSSFKFTDARYEADGSPVTAPSSGGFAATRTAIICYDSHPGGIGFAAKAWELAEEILAGAAELVTRCSCTTGCPACVGDYQLPRPLVRWALQRLLDATVPVPAEARQTRRRRGPMRPRLRKRFGWDDIGPRWEEVRAALVESGEAGSAFLAQVPAAAVRGDKLVLVVGSPGVAAWLERKDARRQLMGLFGHHLRMPERWRLVAEVIEGAEEHALRRSIKLRRRLEDIHRDDPGTERLANDKLAGGILLPSDGTVN